MKAHEHTKIPLSPGRPAPQQAPTKQMSVGDFLLLALGGFVCLLLVLLYTILPIAGLALLPFFFFGGVCLMTSIADALGFYR